MSEELREEEHEAREADTENEGPTLEELQAMLEEKEKALEKAQSHIGKLNEESAERRHKLKEEKSEKQQMEETLTEFQSRLEATEKRAAVNEAIASHNGVREILAPMLEKSAEIKDGQILVGNESVDQYIANLKKDERYGGAFFAPKTNGGNSWPGGQKSSGHPAVKKARTDMTNREKMDYINQYGNEAYQNLPLWGKK